MNKNDILADLLARAIDSLPDDLADLLVDVIDFMPVDSFDLPAPDAQAILDALPESPLRASLRDAFRDNIDTDHAFN